jgi:hypothetical protein
MEFTDFMLWKAIAILVIVFLYGIWKGMNGH